MQAIANVDDLLEMSEQLDQMDLQDFQSAIQLANNCSLKRDFKCAEAELQKAEKSANSVQDKKTLQDGKQLLAEEKRKLANEIKLAEEARIAEQERIRIAQENARRQAEESERENEPSLASQLLVFGTMVAENYQQIKADQLRDAAEKRQIFEKMQSSVEAGIERDQQRFARDRAEIEAKRSAKGLPTAANAYSPSSNVGQHQSAQVVTPNPNSTPQLKKPNTVPNGTIREYDPQPNAYKLPSQEVPDSFSLTQNTGNPSNQDASAKSSNKKVWGPLQLEALAICRKSDNNGKWWCDGPGQDLIIFDRPSVEDALTAVGCDDAISAAGGRTKGGVAADVYRCGYGIRSYDRDIAKIHGLVTARRQYMCLKNNALKCKDFYEGQIYSN